ncbi:MAG: DUF1080 domain-containing protein [Pirellulaceae bacterium]|nr:DUF1080 domain-containing protein [Pirellulaceae bacterium]
MNISFRLPVILLGCLFTAVSAAAEPAGYEVPAITDRIEDLPFSVQGDVTLQDGVLVLPAGGASLRTHARLADFQLDLQFRTAGEKNTGRIVFGAQDSGDNAAESSGYSIGLAGAAAGRLTDRADSQPGPTIPPGQWHRLQLTVAGTTAELLVNGQRCWRLEDLPLRTGWLEFRSGREDGAVLELREIRITESGHRSMFNGSDLSGWEGAGSGASDCWEVRDGLLLCTGKRGPWLRSAEEHGDFNLRLEYKLKPGGNSGVYIRVPTGGSHHGEDAGIEVQILDDAADRYKSLKPYQYSGSLYAIVPAEPRVSRPAGQWNTLEIDCSQTAYRVVHNGTEIINATPDHAPELGRRRTAGYLGLQNHSEEVYFRHLRIGPSMADQLPPPKPPIQATDPAPTASREFRTNRPVAVHLLPGNWAPIDSRDILFIEGGMKASEAEHQFRIRGYSQHRGVEPLDPTRRQWPQPSFR